VLEFISLTKFRIIKNTIRGKFSQMVKKIVERATKEYKV